MNPMVLYFYNVFAYTGFYLGIILGRGENSREDIAQDIRLEQGEGGGGGWGEWVENFELQITRKK